MDDWYNVTQEDIFKNGGRALVREYYSGSPSLALRNVYPEHNWDLEKFSNKPKIFEKFLEMSSNS